MSNTPSLTELAAMITGGNAAAAAAPVVQATAVATKDPVQLWREADEVNEQVFQYLMEREDAAGGSGGFGNEFVDSLLRYLRKNGTLTPNQMAAIIRQMNREPEGPTVPVVTGERVTITGVVVSAQERYSRRYDKTELKLTVRDDRGFKVYGNATGGLKNAMGGDRVTFTATTTQGEREPDFGFFSRARDGRIIREGEPTAAPAPVVTPAAAPLELAELFGNERVLRALCGALSVSIAETDGSPLEHLLHAQLSAAIDGQPIPREAELPSYIGGTARWGEC